MTFPYQWIVPLLISLGTCCITEPASADFGVSDPAVTLESVLGPRVEANCSETVHVYQMQGVDALGDRERVGCPFEDNSLESFEARFASATEDEDLWLMNGDRLLVSCSPDVFYGRVYVEQGARLVFNDRNITFRAREIRVAPGGEMWIGSESCPVYSVIEIRLVGNAVIGKPPGSPSKGILCGGLLEMHGKRYAPTWTRLARTAMAGSFVLEVVEPTNWEVGQRILVTTSASYDCPDHYASTYCGGRSHQNEERTIVAIDKGRKLLQLDCALLHDHVANAAYQAEVALLSRRVRIVGEESGDNFGAHCLIWAPGVGRFSGVQGSNMGQLNIIGRYPFHFHMLGDSPSSYIEDSSVVHSNFRAIVIHGTSAIRASRNVVYDVQGSAVYLEDGVEERNIIEHNLVAHVHPILRPALRPEEVQYESWEVMVPSDVAASPFYISNAYNVFRGNVASGGWSGFFFINFKESQGLSQGYGFPPWSRPTLVFEGNVAHSSGFYSSSVGACIYQGGWLRINPRDNYLIFSPAPLARDTSIMEWNDTKVWMCGAQGLSYTGSNWFVHGVEVHATPKGIVQAGQGTLIRDALVVGSGKGTIGLEFNGSIVLEAVTFRALEIPLVPAAKAVTPNATVFSLALENMLSFGTVANMDWLHMANNLSSMRTTRNRCALPYDLNWDGIVDAEDLRMFLQSTRWHSLCPAGSPCASLDCNRDGIIDIIDGGCLLDSYLRPGKL